MKPYYDSGGVQIFHGDCREILPSIEADVLVTDPPYGIAYKSGQAVTLPGSIAGDEDTSLRDDVLGRWANPALVFGSWKVERPARTHTRLIWDTKGALGMGNLSVPWKPSDQEIYVIGYGFKGRRDSNVLRVAPVQSMARNGRVHPHEKPVALMRMLLEKCPPEWVILDPFCGSGSTLRAAKDLGRKAIGIEIEERYREIAATRLGQEVLDLGDGRSERLWICPRCRTRATAPSAVHEARCACASAEGVAMRCVGGEGRDEPHLHSEDDGISDPPSLRAQIADAPSLGNPPYPS